MYCICIWIKLSHINAQRNPFISLTILFVYSPCPKLCPILYQIALCPSFTSFPFVVYRILPYACTGCVHYHYLRPAVSVSSSSVCLLSSFCSFCSFCLALVLVLRVLSRLGFYSVLSNVTVHVRTKNISVKDILLLLQEHYRSHRFAYSSRTHHVSARTSLYGICH